MKCTVEGPEFNAPDGEARLVSPLAPVLETDVCLFVALSFFTSIQGTEDLASGLCFSSESDFRASPLCESAVGHGSTWHGPQRTLKRNNLSPAGGLSHLTELWPGILPGSTDILEGLMRQMELEILVVFPHPTLSMGG